MYDGHTIAVVVPAYNEEGLVGDVVRTMPGFVDRIYVVDDASTDGTWAEIAQAASEVNERRGGTASETSWPNVVVPLSHERNRGVGGAIKTGYQEALDDGVDVVAVMGGDGQMPPGLLADVVRPVVEGRADYAKGNRLATPNCRSEMPTFRYVGNHVLSYLTKIASGYWGAGDPQNGFTAVSADVLRAVDLEAFYEDYGYCNDILVRMNLAGVRVAEVPQPPTYGDEESDITYSTYIPKVSAMLLRQFVWRIWDKYATRLHPVAISYVLAAVLFVAGTTSLLGSLAAGMTDGYNVPLAVLSVSVLACLLAMALDREVNRPLSFVSSPGRSDEREFDPPEESDTGIQTDD